jgi:hypothetical protein
VVKKDEQYRQFVQQIEQGPARLRMKRAQRICKIVRLSLLVRGRVHSIPFSAQRGIYLSGLKISKRQHGISLCGWLSRSFRNRHNAIHAGYGEVLHFAAGPVHLNVVHLRR